MLAAQAGSLAQLGMEPDWLALQVEDCFILSEVSMENCWDTVVSAGRDKAGRKCRRRKVEVRRNAESCMVGV